jgi:hypothetical protein
MLQTEAGDGAGQIADETFDALREWVGSPAR